MEFFERSAVPGYVQRTDGKTIGLGQTVLTADGLPPGTAGDGDGLE